MTNTKEHTMTEHYTAETTRYCDEDCHHVHYVCECGTTYDGPDCGHVPQPTPVAPDERGRPVCDACYAAQSL